MISDTSSEQSYIMVGKHPSTLAPSRLTVSPLVLAHPKDTEPVSDLIYAGFLEHLGRCIYGGIVDNPKHPSPASLLEKTDVDERTKGRLGFRKDVMKLLGKDGDLEIPMLRWPGGNFVSNYHWQDGIGPVEDRPKRIELAWLTEESNK